MVIARETACFSGYPAPLVTFIMRTCLDVRVWNPFPEPGVNLDLYQNLDAVSAHNEGDRKSVV